MSNYPNSIDSYGQIRLVVDRESEIIAGDHNALRDAIIKIEQTLGINPQSAYGTVVARLDSFDYIRTSFSDHILGSGFRHHDIDIDAYAKSGTNFNLDAGTVNSQLTSFLSSVNIHTNGDGYKHADTKITAAAKTGTYYNLSAGTVNSQITELLNNVMPGATYPGSSPKSFADGYTLPASSLSDAITQIVNRLGTSTGIFSIGAQNLYSTPNNKFYYSGYLSDHLQDSIDYHEERANLLERTLDSFIISGMSVVKQIGSINAVVSTGVFTSNGRLIDCFGGIVTVPTTPGTYYVYAKIENADTSLYCSSTLTNLLTSPTALLCSFTHDGVSSWSNIKDLRRYGSFVNNKSCFTVGATSFDGYAADFMTFNAAINHIELLKTFIPDGKVTTYTIKLVSDITINQSIEISDSYGLEFDGGLHTMVSENGGNYSAFSFTNSHDILIHDFIFKTNITNPASATASQFIDIVGGSNIKIYNNKTDVLDSPVTPPRIFTKMTDRTYTTPVLLASGLTGSLGVPDIYGYVILEDTSASFDVGMTGGNLYLINSGQYVGIYGVDEVIDPTHLKFNNFGEGFGVPESGIEWQIYSVPSSTIYGLNDVFIYNNIAKVSSGGILCNAPSATCYNVFVENNIITKITDPLVTAESAVHLACSNNLISINNNIFSGNFIYGIRLSGSVNPSILNNIISGEMLFGITANVINALIDGNSISGKTQGIQSRGLITNNFIYCYPTALNQVMISIMGNNTLVSNNLIYYSVQTGISDNNLSDNKIINNILYGTTGSTIAISDIGSRCDISGNYINGYKSLTNYGIIGLHGSASNTKINDNCIYCGSIDGYSIVGVGNSGINACRNFIYSDCSSIPCIGLFTADNCVINDNFIYGLDNGFGILVNSLTNAFNTINNNKVYNLDNGIILYCGDAYGSICNNQIHSVSTGVKLNNCNTSLLLQISSNSVINYDIAFDFPSIRMAAISGNMATIPKANATGLNMPGASHCVVTGNFCSADGTGVGISTTPSFPNELINLSNNVSYGGTAALPTHFIAGYQIGGANAYIA